MEGYVMTALTAIGLARTFMTTVCFVPKLQASETYVTVLLQQSPTVIYSCSLDVDRAIGHTVMGAVGAAKTCWHGVT